MTEKLCVKKFASTKKKNITASYPSAAEFRLAAEKMAQKIEQKAELRAKGMLKPEDDVLEIWEWV